MSDDQSAPVQKKENPNAPKPVIRLEKRVGKYVTVVAGLHTYGAERLNAMAREWKTLCGAGGTVKNGVIEIQGDKVQLVGFGGFETKKREARMGRNPKTKEAIEIPATTIPVFKAGKALKEKTAK